MSRFKRDEKDHVDRERLSICFIETNHDIGIFISILKLRALKLFNYFLRCFIKARPAGFLKVFVLYEM